VLKGIDTAEAEKEARDVVGWFHNVFGDRYFIEVMNNGVDIQRMQLEGAVEIAKRMGMPVVTTSDTHYVDPEDAEAQDIMLCINTGRFRTDTSRMKMDGNQYFLRSPEQMYEKFPGLEDAVARSQEIADSVDIDLENWASTISPSLNAPIRKSRSIICESCALKGCWSVMRGTKSG
jgi:DNA polymerase III subunit alpha